jgi:toxin ParE1/3/4
LKERRVVLAPEAADDLNELYSLVAAQASPEVALSYLERVELRIRARTTPV